MSAGVCIHWNGHKSNTAWGGALVLYLLSATLYLALDKTSSLMSRVYPVASSSSSNFQSIFNAALESYEKKTKCKLLSHPLAAQLQSCNSSIAVLSVLQDLIQEFDHCRNSDERLTNWLSPTVNVLYAFSNFIGQGVGLVSLYLTILLESVIRSSFFQVISPANVVFSGIGILLSVSIVLDLSASYLNAGIY